MTRDQAQQRVDQVSAFSREMLELERDGVLRLAPADRVQVDTYHAQLLNQLASQFDVDRGDRQRQMSLGMRTASLLGAVTLSVAVVLFFYRFWGLLGTAAQMAVLVAAPLGMVIATHFAARREKTLYLASITAAVATAAFVLDMNAVGVIFNMRPTPVALALWSGFALSLAYTLGLRLLLAAGIILAMAAACASVADAAGLDWSVAIVRPEPLLPAGGLAMAAAFLASSQHRSGFPETWRLAGSVAILVPLIFLSTWAGVFSYAPWPERVTGSFYDVAGFVLGGAGIWVGIRAKWREVINASTGFLILFLYAKCFDWWWNWLPRYLFFLLLGALAVAVLLVLGRFRSRLKEV